MEGGRVGSERGRGNWDRTDFLLVLLRKLIDLITQYGALSEHTEGSRLGPLAALINKED